MADFAASVEIQLSPGLKGYPVVIAPVGVPRALVYDMVLYKTATRLLNRTQTRRIGIRHLALTVENARLVSAVKLP